MGTLPPCRTRDPRDSFPWGIRTPERTWLLRSSISQAFHSPRDRRRPREKLGCSAFLGPFKTGYAHHSSGFLFRASTVTQRSTVHLFYSQALLQAHGPSIMVSSLYRATIHPLSRSIEGCKEILTSHSSQGEKGSPFDIIMKAGWDLTEWCHFYRGKVRNQVRILCRWMETQ